jgi:hypothetical protein
MKNERKTNSIKEFHGSFRLLSNFFRLGYSAEQSQLRLQLYKEPLSLYTRAAELVIPVRERTSPQHAKLCKRLDYK